MGDEELTAFHFRQAIYAIFREALSDDLRSIEVSTRDLHDRVANRARSNQEALRCCEVMRAVFNPASGDLLIKGSDAGCDLELMISYAIPRPEWGKWR